MALDEFQKQEKKYDTAAPYAACYVLLRDEQGRVAFVMRANTVWMNGYYGLPAGKVELGESMTAGAIREAKEEAGVDIEAADLRHVLTNYRREYGESMCWVDVLFEVDKYKGEAHNAEPHMHSELAWLDLKALPDNVIPSLRHMLDKIVAGEHYAEYGWDQEGAAGA